LQRRPAAVPAGLPRHRLPVGQHPAWPRLRRWRAGPHRSVLRRREQRRGDREVRRGGNPMTTSTESAGTRAPADGPEPERDDRVAMKGVGAALFARPEVGALVGAIVVAVLFFAIAPAFRNPANIGTVLYAAASIGIMAIGVSLLMVGGEFDLSTGVAATFSGIVAALSAWNFGLNVWVGVALALVFSLGVGAFNGWLLMRTGLPSFLVTLGTFFILQGVNLGMTR